MGDDREEEGEELLLDTDDVLTSPVGSAPIAPPEDEDSASADDLEQPAEQAKSATGTGGTLFERMSNIARGAPKAQLDDDGGASFNRDPIDIPRFLNRQNNQ